MAKSQNKNQKESQHKLNHNIKAHTVRLVGGEGGPEIVKLSEALDEAENAGLDLVLINEQVQPPIVKIMDYAKFIYEQSKKVVTKSKPQKEVRFTPNTDDNDVAFKTKHIIGFLSKGHQVKVYVQFKGREITFAERGEKLLLKLAIDIEEYGTIEGMPKLEGKKMLLFIKPKTKK